MGYRLHFASKYQVEYGGGAFSHNSYEFAELARAELDAAFEDEDGSWYEIMPDVLKEYITKLLKKPGTKNEYLTDYTNKEVAQELQEILDGYDKSNDYIRLEWF